MWGKDMNRQIKYSFTRFIKSHAILLSILAIGIFFRVYHFNQIPPSLNWDEVSIGYNAYSILKTGKDEFGNRFPLYFRSLDDYKMPVYVYMTVAAEMLLGLTDVAVRITSLLFGILTIYLMYVLAMELTRKKDIALLSAFATAITPWNIMFSRMASEANVAMALTLLAMILFLRGIRNNFRLLSLSVLVFGIASYTYLSFRAVAPLIGALLFIIHIKEILKNRTMLLSLLIPGILVGGFLIRDLMSPTAAIRFSGTNFLSHSSELLEINEREMAYDGTLGINIPRRIIHDSPIFSGFQIIARAYLSHFSADFLLYGIGHKQESSIFSGLMYLWMLPCMLLGLYVLFVTQRKTTIAAVLLWILIPPIPASITWDAPHAIRTLGMSIGLAFLVALGMSAVLEFIKNRTGFIQKSLLYVLLCVFVVGEGFVFFHQYTIHVPYERSFHWQYSYREMTEYVEAVKNQYDKIIISTKLEWPYAFMLYYTKYDPDAYLAQGGTKSGSWSAQENTYDKFEFRRIDLKNDFATPNILMIGDPDDFSQRKDFIRSFHYLDGKTSIVAFESPRK